MGINIEGKVKLKKRRVSDDKIIYEQKDYFSNIVTGEMANFLYNNLSSLGKNIGWTNEGLMKDKYCQIGTGTGTPDKTDTALWNKLGVADIQNQRIFYDNTNKRMVLRENYRTGDGEYTGTITELGLSSSADGSLITHTLVKDSEGNTTSINLDSEEYLEIEYLIFVSIGSLETKQFTYDSITYDVQVLENIGVLMSLFGGKINKYDSYQDYSIPTYNIYAKDTGGGVIEFDNYDGRYFANMKSCSGAYSGVNFYGEDDSVLFTSRNLDDSNDSFEIVYNDKLDKDMEEFNYDTIALPIFMGYGGEDSEPGGGYTIYDYNEWQDNDNEVDYFDVGDIDIAYIYLRLSEIILKKNGTDNEKHSHKYDYSVEVNI